MLDFILSTMLNVLHIITGCFCVVIMFIIVINCFNVIKLRVSFKDLLMAFILGSLVTILYFIIDFIHYAVSNLI